jgi:hypothetical protein
MVRGLLGNRGGAGMSRAADRDVARDLPAINGAKWCRSSRHVLDSRHRRGRRLDALDASSGNPELQGRLSASHYSELDRSCTDILLQTIDRPHLRDRRRIPEVHPVDQNSVTLDYSAAQRWNNDDEFAEGASLRDLRIRHDELCRNDS